MKRRSPSSRRPSRRWKRATSPLEEATRLLARGAELARTCNDLLAKAELQVSRIRRNFQGQADVGEEPQQPMASPQQDFGMFDDAPR